jgi:5-methylcytosine-specific restriction endonuclease McrA
MKKEDRLKIYRKYDGHCAYCGKSIEYKDMQVDHLVPKNRGCYSRWSDKVGKFVVSHGDDSMENYMPSCRACNFRKRDMSIGQFREAIKEQAKGLLKGAAKFQVSMSIAYGLLNPAFDKPIVFYFEKFKKNDKKYNK